MPSAQAHGTARSGDDGRWMDHSGWTTLEPRRGWVQSSVPHAVQDVEVLVGTVLSLCLGCLWLMRCHPFPLQSSLVV